MIVIFAEKPDMATKIAAAIGDIKLNSGQTIKFEELEKYENQLKALRAKNGYLLKNWNGEETYVTWGFGHLCELKKAKEYDISYQNWRNLPVPFFPNKWEVRPNPATIKQFNIVKDLCKKANYIINATDDDREGEVIFSYLYECMNIKTPYKYRMYISATNKKGMQDALNNLGDAKKTRLTELAGRARGIADASIGWNCTAQMTLKYGTGKEIVNEGRCQIPTLGFLVKREKEIKNFKSKDYFVINGLYDKTGIQFKGEYANGRFDTKEDAKKIFEKIKGKPSVVTKVEKKDMIKQNPSLYNLILLQMDANSKYKISSKETLDIAQELYAKGYTTYPRTDSLFLHDNMMPDVMTILDNLEKLPEYSKYVSGHPRNINKANYLNSSKVVGGHFAIIPTSTIPTRLTDKEAKVYDLICKSVIRMIYDVGIISKTNVEITVEDEVFKCSGSVISQAGWLEVDAIPKLDILPNLTLNETISNATYSVVAKKTEPPKRYTEKTLLAAMLSAGKELEDADLKKFMASHKIEGIGRPSTRAGIIEKIVSGGYAARGKDNIYATDEGIRLIDITPFEEIKSAELTAMWETRLSDIENGNETYEHFLEGIKELTKEWCEKIINAAGGNKMGTSNSGNSLPVLNGAVCPDCGGQLVKQSWGYGCSNYRASGCKFGIGTTIAKRPITDDEIIKLINNKEVGPLDGFVGNNGTYSKKLLLVTNSEGLTKAEMEKSVGASNITTSKYKCPECGKPMNEFDWGFGCSGYRSGCSLSVGKKAYEKTLTQTEIKELLTKGETNKPVTGLKYNNKEFESILILSNGRVKCKPKNK